MTLRQAPPLPLEMLRPPSKAQAVAASGPGPGIWRRLSLGFHDGNSDFDQCSL